MSLLKTLAIITFLILYFVYFVFGKFGAKIEPQIAWLVAFLILNSIVCSIKDTMKSILWLLPFLLVYSLLGVIFHYIALLGRTDWLQDTYLKLLLFPNALFVFKISFALITLKDIYNLPVPMYVKSHVITVKAVMIKGQNTMVRFKTFLDTYPYINDSKIKVNGSLILSLFLYLEKECQNQWYILENKLNHLKTN